MSVLLLSFLTSLFPIALYGQAEQEVTRVLDIFRTILSSSQVLIAIAVTLAFFYFFYNIAVYIRNRGRDSTKGAEEAKEKLLWSVIAIFVLTSIWGIIFFLFRVFIGDSAPGNTAVGYGLPIESIRLSEGDPLNPSESDDRTGPGDDDRTGVGNDDRTGVGTGSRTGPGGTVINLPGGVNDGSLQQFDATMVETPNGYWIAERKNANGSTTRYLVREINNREQRNLNTLKTQFNHFIDNDYFENPENGKEYTFIVKEITPQRRGSADPLQVYEVPDIKTKSG